MIRYMVNSLILIGPVEAQQTLGQALARARLNRNWSQQALAARAGVSLPTISRLERGQGASLEAFLKMAAALELLEPLLQALQVTHESAKKIQSLDELEKQLTPRRRGRSG